MYISNEELDLIIETQKEIFLDEKNPKIVLYESKVLELLEELRDLRKENTHGILG